MNPDEERDSFGFDKTSRRLERPKSSGERKKIEDWAEKAIDETAGGLQAIGGPRGCLLTAPRGLKAKAEGV